MDKVHNLVEISHVFADHEGRVAGIDLLVMDHHGGIQLVSGPLSIGYVSEVILSSDKHSNWNRCNFPQIDLRWSVLAIFLLVDILGAPVIKDHVWVRDHLTVVHETLDACASWEMTHVDLESFRVIK